METKKFKPIVNQEQETTCPSTTTCPHPLPPPKPCPYPHGQIFQGCIAYINSYIDIRIRQLYIKLKDYVYKIAGKYFGPWDYIILKDINHPENEYKLFVKDEQLMTDGYETPIDEDEESGETDSTESRLAIVSANVVQLEQDTQQMETRTQDIDLQISTLESDVSTLGTRIQAVGTSISSLERSMRAVAASVSAMGTSITSLESRVAKLERDGSGSGEADEPDPNVYVLATTFISEINKLNGSITGINGSIVSLQSQITNNHNEAEEQFSGLNTRLSQVEGLGTRVSAIESMNLDSRTTSLETQVQTIQQDVSQLKSNSDTQPSDPSSGGTTTDPELEGRMDVVEANVEQLTSNVNTLTTSVSTLTSDVSSLKTFKNTVEGYGIPTMNSDIANLKNRVQTLEESSSGSSDTSDIDDELEALSDRIAVLEQRTSGLGDLANYSISILTMEQYNQIQEKDNHTLYFIVGE